jgi:SHS2 domain-containing protein
MRPEASSFEEIEHTADWAIRVRGATLPDLFANAARAMYSLVVDLGALPLTETRTVEVEGVSVEGMLVKWLNELLYITEIDHLAFSRFHIEALDAPGDPPEGPIGRLLARVEGGPARELRKYIKAATYHGLSVRRDTDGYSAEIVFDV